jgi:hypothetical protein
VPVHAMQVRRGSRGIDVALYRAQLSAACPSCFTPREGSLDSYTVGGWIGPVAAAAIVEKSKICICSTLSAGSCSP